MSGLVALGDSITHGDGSPSWAERLAATLGLVYTQLAWPGARAADVRQRFVPRLEGPYAVGTLYIGVNDARAFDWDPAAYERDLRSIATALAARCERVVLCTIPADLGRPPAAPKPRAASAIVRAVAGEHGAGVADLDDLAGPRWLLSDAVHPTAAGQIEIAERAARALASAARARG
jgi:lysophospholipase L1-like esterase